MAIGVALMEKQNIEGAAATLSAILKEVEAKKVHLYQSLLKQPYIVLCVEGRPTGRFPLFDPSVKHWLADFAWEKELGLLRARELDRILSVLAGRAMATTTARVDDPSLLRVILAEPVVHVVLEFVNGQQSLRIEEMMQPLWNKLKEFAKERGLLQIGRKRFPGGANVLSRQLSHFAPIFEQLGIQLELVRRNGCRITLTRLDDSAVEPSAEPSADNSCPTRDLSPEDDRERRRALLLARRHPEVRTPSDGESSL